MAQENSISLCMIVKDEEDYLEACLNSVKGLVDEIIIVDTGSKDRTKEIAGRFTDRVFDFEWVNDFSKARNFSLSKATKDWILVLDADESISKIDHEKVRRLVNSGEAEGFLLNNRLYTNKTGIANWVSTKDDPYEESRVAPGYYLSTPLRLFKNTKAYFYEGKIHETPHNSIVNSGGRITHSDVILHHYGSLDNYREMKKRDAYIEMLKQRIRDRDFSEKPEDFVCFEIGRELTIAKRYEEAIEFYERAIQIQERFNYLLGLGGLYITMGRLREAERMLKKAVVMEPRDPFVHNNLGIIFAKNKEFNKAIRKFEKVIEMSPNFADAYFNLGLVNKERGKLARMRGLFNKAVELNPEYRARVEAAS